jgi:hypothetical protein
MLHFIEPREKEECPQKCIEYLTILYGNSIWRKGGRRNILD